MKLKLLLVLSLLVLNGLAQSPKLINYQGAARRADGTPIVNKLLGLKFELLEGGQTGTVITSETQTVLTNNYGLFTTQIGKNTVNTGLINWQNGPHILQVSIDTTGGTSSYIATYTNQIASVPFAIHSENVPSTYSNNVLTIGKNSYTIASGVTPTITALGILTNTAVGNNFTLNVANPVLSNTSNILSISQGTAISTVTLPAQVSQTISTIGIATVTNGLNSSTISVANPILTNTANILSISQGSAISTVTLPSQSSQTLASLGIATVTNGLNSATITVPNPVLSSNGNTLTITQGTAITTATVPSQTPQVISGSGIASSANGLNSATITVPAPVLSNTANVLAINQGTAVSTVTLPSQVPQVISGSGIASSANGLNSATITVPAPVLSNTANVLAINQGTAVSTVTLPAQVPQTITGAGIASVSSPGSNSFVVSVIQPTFAYSQTNGSLTSGTSSANITPSLSLSGTTLTSGPSSNSINLSSLSPWTQVGGTVALTSSSNNVGVGLSNPGSKLDVLGVSTATTSVLKITNTSSLSATGALEVNSAGGNAAMRINQTAALGDALVVNTAGGNGISSIDAGTGNNDHALVANQSNTANANSYGAFVTGGEYLKGKDALASSYALRVQNGNSTDILSVKNSGFIGIGNTNPSANLEINGTNTSTVLLRVVGTNSTNLNGDLTSISNGFANFNVVNTHTSGSGINITSIGNGINISNSGPAAAVFAQSTNTSVNAGFFSGGIFARGSTTNAAAYAIYAQDQNSNAIFGVRNDGNVGVGLGNPIEKLDVGGSVGFTGALKPNGLAGTAGQVLMSQGTSSAPVWATPTTTFAYSQTNGSLTSGTSSANITPSLALLGTTLTSGPASNSINLSALSPWSQTGGTVSLLTSSNIVSIGANTPSLSNTGLILGRTGAFDNRMVITGGDNSNTYGGMLTMTENQNQIQGMTLKMDGSSNRFLITSDPTGTNYVMGIGGYSGINQGVSLGNGYALSNPPSNGMIVQGNVGIGNASPTATLHVTGTSRFVDGTQGAGKVLTSDASGNASWVAIPSQTYAYSQINGSLTSGTSSVNITPSLNLSGYTITAGPTSNSINLSSITPWSQTGGTVALNTSTSNVGIGVSNPTTKLAISSTTTTPNFAQYTTLNFNPSTNPGGAAGAGYFMNAFNGTGGTQFNTAITGYLSLAGGSSSSSYNTGAWLHGISTAGNHNNMMGVLGSTEVYGSSVGNVYGGYFTHMANTGTVTNGYGVYIGSVLGSNKWSLYSSDAAAPNYFAGRVGIGNTAPSASLDINGTLKYVDGSQGAGKVLTSDASGNATWSTTASSGWGLTGNANTTATINYIGTSDNIPLSFRVNGQAAGRIDHLLQNVFFGHLSGLSNSTGANNAAVGTYALWQNTSGGGNVAFGQSALYSNSTGLNNTATGYGALYGNTTGSLNTASGESALYQNAGGVENAAFGRASMYSNNGGSRNSAFGSGALYSNVGGTNNTALGQQAGFSSVSGSGNVFIGANAGYYETTSNKLWIANSTTSTTPLIYGNFTTGNVALGLVNPSQKLSVDGNIGLDDANASSAPSRTIGFATATIGNHGMLSIQAKSNVFSGTAFVGGNLLLAAGDFNFSGATNSNGGDVFIRAGKNTFDGSGGGNIIFQAAGNAYTERMRVEGVSGRIGIGTSAPTATLHVNGTTRLVDGTQGAGKVLTSDASGNATWSTTAAPSRVRSIVIEPGSMNINGAYAAAPATYSMVGGWQRPCVVMADGAMTQVQLHIAVPSDWNAASSFTVRILYGSPGTSGNFAMQTLYSNIGLNSSAVAASSGGGFNLSQSSTAEGLSEYQDVISIGASSKVLQYTLRRNGASGSDTSSDPMRLYGIAIDYRD